MLEQNKIIELMEAVDEKVLTKDQLENYHHELSILLTKLTLEQAELEKKEAIFFAEQHQDLSLTDIAIKRQWKAGKDGQRAIDLKHWGHSLKTLMGSVKSRLFASY